MAMFYNQRTLLTGLCFPLALLLTTTISCQQKDSNSPVFTCDDGILNQDEQGIDCGGVCSIACPSCTDGILNQNEQGIDCGGVCPTACPTCTDGILNQNEQGIDCGGVCSTACPSCTDGILNQNEQGIDCGGVCSTACPSCTDGILNQNEQGIDCGGVCSTACPSCTDGILNQNEQGIDCGGVCSTACPSCTDGILNQDEVDIDCGGSCSACPALSINAIEPDFGLPGQEVRITVTGRPSLDLNAVTVNFGAADITVSRVEANAVIVVIPPGASTAPLDVRFGTEVSNAVVFNVSENGLRSPNPSNIITARDGTRIVTDYILVTLIPALDTTAEANRLAQLVNGSVCGRISSLNLTQICVNTTTIEGAEALRTTLALESSVATALLDVIVEEEVIDWSGDPGAPNQRRRNRVEEGAALYERSVSLTDSSKVAPFFMGIGVSEVGIDNNVPDFSGYQNAARRSENVSIFSLAQSGSVNHGTNVVGVIAAELQDGGNAGIVRALAKVHGGANISVGAGSVGSVAQRILHADRQLDAGALVLNWSWGIHRANTTTNCSGNVVNNNTTNANSFDFTRSLVDSFFESIRVDHPNAVIVSSAGNGSTDSSDQTNRQPSSNLSSQLIVVGAHTTTATITNNGRSFIEDDLAATVCFDANNTATVKRADYSNYGSRVDISAAGTIYGFNVSTATTSPPRGTSFAAPLVAATVALMQSINPNLSPEEIKNLLRRSALPIENTVQLPGNETGVFTRPLSTTESSRFAGQGARLNVEGAIQAALDSLTEDTLPIAQPVRTTIPPDTTSIVVPVQVQIPSTNVFNEVDIMFLVDISGSYRDDITTFRNQANQLITAFASSGNDVQIGLASFSDFPRSPYGAALDIAFTLDQVLTSDPTQVISALNALRILSGGDGPESQLEALFQTAQAATGWRAGALPIIFLATDASFHNSDIETAYPGTGRTATLAALQARRAKVFGLQSGGNIPDVQSIVSDTEGQAFLLSRNSAEIVNAVETAIAGTSRNLSVSLTPVGDFSGLIRSIRPTDNPSAVSGTPVVNVNPGDTVSFNVEFTRGNTSGSTQQTFSFRLSVTADEVAVIQDIPVIVTIN